MHRTDRPVTMSTQHVSAVVEVHADVVAVIVSEYLNALNVPREMEMGSMVWTVPDTESAVVTGEPEGWVAHDSVEVAA